MSGLGAMEGRANGHIPASARAKVYLSQHPELFKEALERAQRLGMFEKPKRRLKSAVLDL